MSNPITNCYKIDRSNPEFIKVVNLSTNNEYEMQQRHETFKVQDCFITRFEQFNDGSDEQKYIQYTDINGISSETILTQKDYDELKEDVLLEQDYLVMAIDKNDSPEDVFYAYITLTDVDSEDEDVTFDKPV